jgi:hypothetical protein
MNRRNWIIAAGLLLALPGMALAAKPGYLHVKESVEINASPAKVWSLVKNWNGLHKWHPAFSNTEIKSGENNKIGSYRTLTMADGGAKFDEELLGFNDKKKLYSYRIVGDSPLPVADYSSSIQVKPGKAKGTSVLVWNRPAIRAITERYPRIMENALWSASDYIDWLLAAHVALSAQTAQQRLAGVLVSLAPLLGRAVPGGVELDVTNEELAGAAHITPFTTSRLLNEWQRHRTIIKRRGRVVLLAPERLIRSPA